MPKYVIERDIQGVGDWSAEQLQVANSISEIRTMIDPTTAEG
jgi:hypothetical protein